MAHLVVGVGCSHSPMVTMDGHDWLEWGSGDRRHPMLYTEDGRHVTYDQRLAEVGGSLAERATATLAERDAARVDAAVARLRETLAGADLDAVIIVGDDQDEHLSSDNLPPFLVYWGDTIENAAMGGADGKAAGDLSDLQRRYLPGYREPVEPRHYPVDVPLARHLIAAAMEHGFDVAASARLPRAEEGMGHAFGFVVRRLLGEVPIVPIMVNTYHPPTQPRAGRCRDFGTMLSAAVDAFDPDARIGVVASGGLSHFIVAEDLDRRVLDAFARGDLDAVTSIPEATFVAGTSEIKNWVVVAAMCSGHSFEVVDYVPGYRTPAGTGTGLAFAEWT